MTTRLRTLWFPTLIVVVALSLGANAALAGKPPKDGDDASNDELTGMPFNEMVGADRLHAEGIDGTGITVAVVDTGHYSQRGLNKNTANRVRMLAQYDARLDELRSYNPLENTDESGHGAHVASVAVNSTNLRSNRNPAFAGVAPNAELVIVHAFDRYGSSTYADVIRGLQWILDNAASYGIRVVNLSFSAEPRSYYWDDPLNQAVMRLWQAGIVVVASAGNRGPEAMTIGVPGNVPYVITVGAMTDNFTPGDPADDILALFSSTGPTVEGFVKPEVVAPGGHVKGLMATSTELAVTHPEFHDGANYFVMSGTSQAAAVVTGVVALMLQQSPHLTPDEVKYRLMESARPATFKRGSLVYPIFQQGAGRVDAYGAVYSDTPLAANRGLDIDLDLAGLAHFGGAADAYANHGGQDYTFFVRDADGNPVEDDGFLWSDEYVLQDGFLWSDGFL